MYLKSIEVQGFKSFANKIKLEFLNGITGIVGPNGSGKSNVADAVRWVFGEQRPKQLRSSGMQDLIFSGTEMRKPQSFAEVSITLDNTDRAVNFDADEVTVTRKVFRSGDSEYRLNGTICRLKDISELFYDTGIGKEGYSIIGQGQVDRILSARPEERRELFDEACGIVKFKKRKNETLKRLQSEHDNMVRVKDILSELERQVGPLEKQAETAKAYLKLRSELRSYDINAFLIDEKSYQTTLEKTNENLKTANEQLSSVKEKEESIRTEYSRQEEIVRDLESKLEDVRTRLNEADKERSEREKEIVLLEEKISQEESRIRCLEEHRVEIASEIDEKNAKIKESEEALFALKTEIDTLGKSLHRKEEEVSNQSEKVALYEAAVEESHGKVIGLMKEQSEVNADLNAYRTKIEEGSNRIEEYEKRLIQYEEEKKASESGRDKAKSECEALSDELREKNQALLESREDLKNATETYQNARQESYDLHEKIQISRGRLESLKAIRERYEGFSPAVKKIMEIRSSKKGVLGTVSDLVQVEKKYQTLIETALGGNYQNIVVDKEDTAKEMVEYLKENRFGRATFLPLDSIRSGGRIQETEVFSEPGVIGTCDSLVTADERVMSAVHYLLDRFLAVDTMENALKVARKYRYTIRIVTLEGEFLNVGGSITGGSFRASASVLGRNDEISTLEKDVEQMVKRAEKVEAELNSSKQYMESCRVEAESLEEEIREIQLKLAEEKTVYDGLERDLIRITAESEDIRTKRSDAAEAKADAEGKLAAYEEALSRIEKANEDSSTAKDETQAVLREAKEIFLTLSDELGALKVTYANAAQKADFLSESIQEDREAIERLSIEDRKQIVETEEAKEAKSSFEKDLAEKQALRDEVAPGSEGLKSTLDLIAGEKEKAVSRQSSLFASRDEIAGTVSTLEKEIVRLENIIERTEERLSGLTEYLWNEYELTPSEAAGFTDHALDDESPSRIRRHADELKKEIRALGPVNVNAIEDFKDVSERYRFLKDQYDDIVKAEERLTEEIRELDKGMRSQFTDAFEKIKTQFDIVYKDLFRGGSGTLIINPEKDVIDADISIHSQPPGKKLQNMMQLSGGEKALTAIALIFAIQNLKPSPFCLLDEIEAALDDTNIVRFTNYLKRLSDETQYVVITHRRGTMMAANRLYGITMQEKGVSTLVSVSLVEKELD